MSTTAIPAPRTTLPAVHLAWVLVWLIGFHFLVDTVASIPQPLWPELQLKLKLGDFGIQLIYLAWSGSNSVCQFLFGYFSDRFALRWLIWGGPLLSVGCLSGLALATTPWAVCLLMIGGGLGVAAFHPEAAAMAGGSLGANRSRAMALFAMGGYLGQSAGPLYSGSLTTAYGMPGLLVTLAWAMPCVLLFAWLLNGATTASNATKVQTGRPQSVRWPSLLLLVCIGTLRVMPAMGLPLVVAFVLKQQGENNALIGMYQSLFLAAIGSGGMASAVVVKPTNERQVLWIMPILVSVGLFSFPLLSQSAWWLAIVVSGFGLGCVFPVLIGFGQRLLPYGQRTASSLTMGVTWGVGSVFVACIIGGFKHFGHTPAACYLFAFGCFISSILCYWLPTVAHDQ